MAQSRANDTPKIIALLAAIGLVLVFAGYQLFSANRPVETNAAVTGVPAMTGQTPNTAATPTANPGTPGASGSVSAPPPNVLSAKSGQVRQFDPVLDADPDGTYPPIGGAARSNSFAQFKPPPVNPPIMVSNTGNRGAKDPAKPGPPLGGFTGSFPPINPSNIVVRPHVDNTPQQEITLDGVVTGSDGLAVLTVREPGRQNALVPEQKRFVHVGDEIISGEKIIEISETGLRLSKTEGTWAVGDKRGVTKRGTLIRIAAPATTASVSAVDAKLPPTQTP